MKATNQTPDWYTVDEIAQLLKVSRSNVYALVEGGRLASHRIGAGRGCIRVSHVDLDAYLAAARR